MAARRKSPPTYPWIGADDADYIDYMRHEWGVPVRDETKLFEMFTLQIFQSGLTWAIILHRWDAFRKAFADWDLHRVAGFGKREINRLAKDASIIRNRPKIEAAVNNAGRIIELQESCGGFGTYLWGFVGDKPIRRNTRCRRWEDLPTESAESRALAKDLKKRGFKFVGPTSMYAFMQAVGLVDDRIGG